MVAKRRVMLADRAAIDGAPARPHVSAADSSHKGFDSPAGQLQARLESALASAGGAYAIEPVIEPWPAAIRLAVLLGGAAGSWALAWGAAKLLI